MNTKKIKTVESNPTYLWHCRLGHINEKCISKLHKDGILETFDFESIDRCEACLLGKMIKTPFTKLGERASDLLGLMHKDVCGPMKVSTRDGSRYFITFTNDYS